MKLVEIQETIHGELPFIGMPCLLIRLGECNLKCPYCDTDVTTRFEKDVPYLVKSIHDSKLPSVLITGGEPYLQAEELKDLTTQVWRNKKIVIETNGTLPMPNLGMRANVTTVMDVKLFDLKSFDLRNLKTLEPLDVIKFVFWSEESFNTALDFTKRFSSQTAWEVEWVFSPTYDFLLKTNMTPYVTAVISLQKKILNQRLFFQSQIHKILGVK